MKINSKSAENTIEYGKILGKLIDCGVIIALEGDLGGGKTQFTKGLAEGLGIKENIVSPTFVIRRDYQGQSLKLFHYDFYRLDYIDQELLEGLLEAKTMNDVVIAIEWAEKMGKNLPKERIDIRFDYVDDQSREISFKFNNNKELENKYETEFIKCAK